ncbi:hypothetical protein ACWM9A_06205 [Acetobacter pasteurianus]
MDEHRQTYGVGSTCKALPIAPSVYYACVVSQKGKELCNEICRVTGDMLWSRTDIILPLYKLFINKQPHVNKQPHGIPDVRYFLDQKNKSTTSKSQCFGLGMMVAP